MSSAAASFLSRAQRVIPLTPSLFGSDLFWIDSLRDADLRVCWEFRRGFMALKPHVHPEEDFQKYVRWIRSADFVWLPRDKKGELTATAFYKVERRIHEGTACILIWPEYMYSRPDQRKGVAIAQGFVVALALGMMKAPLGPQYVVGTGYVPSYLALCQVTEPVFVADSPQMTKWQKTLYQSLVAATPGYDPDSGVVNMGTIPISPRTQPPCDPALHAAWQQYVTQNPRWTEGYTCMVMGQCKLSAVGSVLSRLVERLRRRSRVRTL